MNGIMINVGGPKVTEGSATPGQVVLDGIRKQAKQVRGNNRVSSITQWCKHKHWLSLKATWKPLNNLQVNEASSNKTKPHTGCKHPSHSLPLRSISKLQLYHESQNDRLCPWLLTPQPPDSENNAQREAREGPQAAPPRRGRKVQQLLPANLCPVTSETNTKQATSLKLSFSRLWKKKKTQTLGLPQVIISPRQGHFVCPHLFSSAAL